MVSTSDTAKAVQQEPATPPRRLARDAQGRVGEVMPAVVPAHLRDPRISHRISLRPEGGGREWSVPADEIEYLEPEQ